VKRFRVHIPESVGAEIDRQVLFIADDSVDRAFAWESRLRAQIERLADSYGHAIDEEAWHGTAGRCAK
jgi:plasmid stabilization system protein ParE